MKSRFAVLTALLIAPALFGAHVPTPTPTHPVKDKRTTAIEQYHGGKQRLDNVEKMQQQLKTADGKAAEKLQKKINKQLESAAADFRRSVKAEPTLFQAWSELGFALRKLGRYDQSLEAYDKALSIEPNFGPAIEYRAEAYLGLDRLDEAKQAYTLLFSGDRGLADQLFTAMKDWVAARRQNPNGLDAEQLAQFGHWVEQREAIHRQTSALTAPQTNRSW